jgi:hypothetical protein
MRAELIMAFPVLLVAGGLVWISTSGMRIYFKSSRATTEAVIGDTRRYFIWNRLNTPSTLIALPPW